MYLGEMEGGHYNNATNDQELNQYRGSGEGRKDLIFRMWNLIELDDQLDIGDKRKAWKTDSVDSVLDGREFERKRDNETVLNIWSWSVWRASGKNCLVDNQPYRWYLSS